MPDKIIFVGQADSRTGDPKRPLIGRASDRICPLAGITEEEFVERTICFNLVDDWPGRVPGGKGDQAPFNAMRRRAIVLKNLGVFVFDDVPVILLGRHVAKAFGIQKTVAFFDEVREKDAAGIVGGSIIGPAPWFVAPHPSIASRWWTTVGNVAIAKKFYKRLFGGKR